MTKFSHSRSKPPSCIIDFQFGDQRINRRANLMVNKLIKNIGKSFPQVFCNQADLKGAYRFLENNLVSPDKILQPHITETIKRCSDQKLVAVIQDSSDLDFDYMECLDEFYPMHTNIDKGFRIHPSFVISENGTPLGILATSNYTRDPNSQPKKHRNSLAIEEKESYRWLEGYRETCRLAEQNPNVKVVSIADREGDIYECLQEAETIENQHKAYILVRACHNRCLQDGNDDTDDKLAKKLIRCPISYEGQVTLNKYRKGQRKAYVAVRASKVLLQAPNTCKKKKLQHVEMNAVLVSEIDPPRGEKAIEWLLLTTLPIDAIEDIRLIVSLYAKRWFIEVYFKVLKSGCKVDSQRLQIADKIENYIALAMIVGWKVMLATYLPRVHPDLPCTCLFTEIEWKVAFMAAHDNKIPLPDNIPSIDEMVKLIAMLGGYQKTKKPPGVQTVWRGIVRVMDMVYGYKLFQGIALSENLKSTKRCVQV